jgi:transcriptional antiterminator NusG
MENLLNQIDDSDGAASVSGVSFEPGEILRVTDGLFSGLEGVIEEVDMLRMRLKVSISIFGRPTPVDLDFAHVEKI